MFGKPQINIHYLETLTLEVPLYHFFYRQDKLLVYVFTGLHHGVTPCLHFYCQKQQSD